MADEPNLFAGSPTDEDANLFAGDPQSKVENLFSGSPPKSYEQRVYDATPVEDRPKTIGGDLLNRFMRGTMIGVADTASAVDRFRRRNPPVQFDGEKIIVPELETPQQREDRLATGQPQWIKSMRDTADVVFPANPKLGKDIVSQSAEMAGQFAPAVVASLVSTRAGTAAMAGQQGEQGRYRALADGANNVQAANQGKADAIITAALSGLGSLRNLNKIGSAAAARVIPAAIKTGIDKMKLLMAENPGTSAYVESILREMVEEPIQGAASDFAAQITYDSKTRSPLDLQSRLMDTVSGGTMGAGFGGAAALRAVFARAALDNLQAKQNTTTPVVPVAPVKGEVKANVPNANATPSITNPVSEDGFIYPPGQGYVPVTAVNNPASPVDGYIYPPGQGYAPVNQEKGQTHGQEKGRVQTQGQGQQGLLSPVAKQNETTPEAVVTTPPVVPPVQDQVVTVTTPPAPESEQSGQVSSADQQQRSNDEFTAKVLELRAQGKTNEEIAQQLGENILAVEVAQDLKKKKIQTQTDSQPETLYQLQVVDRLQQQYPGVKFSKQAMNRRSGIAHGSDGTIYINPQIFGKHDPELQQMHMKNELDLINSEKQAGNVQSASSVTTPSRVAAKDAKPGDVVVTPDRRAFLMDESGSWKEIDSHRISDLSLDDSTVKNISDNGKIIAENTQRDGGYGMPRIPGDKSPLNYKRISELTKDSYIKWSEASMNRRNGVAPAAPKVSLIDQLKQQYPGVKFVEQKLNKGGGIASSTDGSVLVDPETFGKHAPEHQQALVREEMDHIAIENVVADMAKAMSITPEALHKLIRASLPEKTVQAIHKNRGGIDLTDAEVSREALRMKLNRRTGKGKIVEEITRGMSPEDANAVSPNLTTFGGKLRSLVNTMLGKGESKLAKEVLNKAKKAVESKNDKDGKGSDASVGVGKALPVEQKVDAETVSAGETDKVHAKGEGVEGRSVSEDGGSGGVLPEAESKPKNVATEKATATLPTDSPEVAKRIDAVVGMVEKRFARTDKDTAHEKAVQFVKEVLRDEIAQAVTTKGIYPVKSEPLSAAIKKWKEKQAVKQGLAEVLSNPNNESNIKRIRDTVRSMAIRAFSEITKDPTPNEALADDFASRFISNPTNAENLADNKFSPRYDYVLKQVVAELKKDNKRVVSLDKKVGDGDRTLHETISAPSESSHNDAAVEMILEQNAASGNKQDVLDYIAWDVFKASTNRERRDALRAYGKESGRKHETNEDLNVIREFLIKSSFLKRIEAIMDDVDTGSVSVSAFSAMPDPEAVRREFGNQTKSNHQRLLSRTLRATLGKVMDMVTPHITGDAARARLLGDFPEMIALANNYANASDPNTRPGVIRAIDNLLLRPEAKRSMDNDTNSYALLVEDRARKAQLESYNAVQRAQEVLGRLLGRQQNAQARFDAADLANRNYQEWMRNAAKTIVKAMTRDAALQAAVEQSVGMDTLMAVMKNPDYMASIISASDDIVVFLANNGGIERLRNDNPATIAQEYQAATASLYKGADKLDRVYSALAFLRGDNAISDAGFALQALRANPALNASVNGMIKLFADQFQGNPGLMTHRVLQHVQSLTRTRTLEFKTLEKIDRQMANIIEDLASLTEINQAATSLLDDPAWQKFRSETQKKVGSRGYKADLTYQGKETARINLPDGSRVELNPHSWLQENFAATQERVKAGIAALEKALTDDPYHPDADGWVRDKGFLEDAYLALNISKPSVLKKLFSGLGSIWETSENLGGRASVILNKAISEVEQVHIKAADWFGRVKDDHGRLSAKAYLSHGISPDLSTPEREQQWNERVFRHLAGSWQGEVGSMSGLKEGDVLINGERITKEDLDFLRYNSKISREGFDIVNDDIISDVVGGVEHFRKRVATNPYMVPRRLEKPEIEAANSMGRAAWQYSGNPADAAARAEFIKQLDANFDKQTIWFLVSRSRVAATTRWDGPGGVLAELVADIKANKFARSKMNTEWIIDELARRSKIKRETASEEFLKNIGDVLAKWHAVNRESPVDQNGRRTIDITSADKLNEFTQARSAPILWDSFYTYGAPTTADLMGFAHGMNSVSVARMIGGFKGVLAILESQKAKFTEAVDFEVLKSRITKEQAKQKLLAANDEMLRLGKTYDNLKNLDKKIESVGVLLDRMGSDVYDMLHDDAFYRGMSLTRGGLLTSTTTTLQNVMSSPIFAARALASASGKPFIYHFGEAMFELLVKQLPIVSAKMAYYGGVKLPVSLIEGLSNAMLGTGSAAAKEANSIVNGRLKKAIHAGLRPFVEATGDAMFTNWRRLRELKEAGLLYEQPYLKKYDAMFALHMRDAGFISTGETGGRVKRALMTGIGVGEAMLATFSSPMHPHAGDVAANIGMHHLVMSKVFPEFQVRLVDFYKTMADAGVFEQRFNVNDPRDPRNVITGTEFFNRFGEKTVANTKMAKLMNMFTHGGVDFQERAIQFLFDLHKGNKQAEFLTEQERLGLTGGVINAANRPTIANTPLILRSKDKWTQFWSVFMGWRMRTASMLNTHVTSIAESDPNVKRFASIAMASAAIIPFLIASALQEVTRAELDRRMKKVLYNMDKNTKQPWERSPDKQGTAWALAALSSIPLVDIAANMMLDDSPQRGRQAFDLVAKQKVEDVMKYIGGVYQTGDITYKLPQLIGGLVPDSKIILRRLDSEEGAIEKDNAANLLGRYGDPELLKPKGKDIGVNASELSPYGRKMANAAMRGDTAELKSLFDTVTAIATRLGRENPEKVAMQLLQSQNPYGSTFKEKLTETQRNSILNKMSASERDMVIGVEQKFDSAVQSLGGKPVSFYEADEKPVRSGGGSSGGGGSTGRLSVNLPPSMRGSSTRRYRSSAMRVLGGSRKAKIKSRRNRRGRSRLKRLAMFR